MTVLVLVETVLLAVLTVLVAGLLRAHGTVLRRLHQLDGGAAASSGGARSFELLPLAGAGAPRSVGPTDGDGGTEPAHDVDGETPGGEVVTTRVVDVRHNTLLLFLSSGCSSCEVFWDELSRPVDVPAGTRLLVVAQDARDESLGALLELAPPGVDVVLSSQAWRDYDVPGSPHVVYVDGPAGRIRGEGTGQSLRQVTELVARSSDLRAAPANADVLAGGLAGGRRLTSTASSGEDAVDRELLAAGVTPGDPRLWQAGGSEATDVE